MYLGMMVAINLRGLYVYTVQPTSTRTRNTVLIILWHDNGVNVNLLQLCSGSVYVTQSVTDHWPCRYCGGLCILLQVDYPAEYLSPWLLLVEEVTKSLLQCCTQY